MFRLCPFSIFQNWTYSKIQQQRRCNLFVRPPRFSWIILHWPAMMHPVPGLNTVAEFDHPIFGYARACWLLLKQVQQLLKLNYCSFGESYHSLIVVGGKGCSNTKVNKTRIWWEAMIRSLVRRFCQKQLSLKTCANYSFLKHRHRRNVTSHHSFSLFWQF